MREDGKAGVDKQRQAVRLDSEARLLGSASKTDAKKHVVRVEFPAESKDSPSSLTIQYPPIVRPVFRP